MNTTIPVLSPLLQSLEARRVGVLLAHVTGPYDVPLRGPRFSLEKIRSWNEHVLSELLEPWSDFPYIVCGFSGGAVLALSGLHSEARCLGAAVFGADELPQSFFSPEHWDDKLRIFVAPHDRVCGLNENMKTFESLRGRGEAKLVRLSSGTHQLADYATEEGLGTVLKKAHMP